MKTSILQPLSHSVTVSGTTFVYPPITNVFLSEIINKIMEDAMKRLFLLFLVIGTCLILFSCSADNLTAPEINQSDQLPAPLAKKVTTYFDGISTNIGVLDPGKTITLPSGRVLIRGLVVQTEDILNDPRVAGIVTWVVNLDIYPDGTDKRWGTGELIIPSVGRWNMPYIGWKREGYVTYEVDGHGKGDLRGLKAHWTYKKEAIPGAPFNVDGYIIERN